MLLLLRTPPLSSYCSFLLVPNKAGKELPEAKTLLAAATAAAAARALGHRPKFLHLSEAREGGTSTTSAVPQENFGACKRQCSRFLPPSLIHSLPDTATADRTLHYPYTIAYRPCAPGLLTLWARAGPAGTGSVGRGAQGQ